MDIKQIGQRIRYYRVLKGLTQQELADRIGVTWEMVSRYENGRTNPMRQLVLIAEALGIPSKLLLGTENLLREPIDTEYNAEVYPVNVPMLDIKQQDLNKTYFAKAIKTTNTFFRWQFIPFNITNAFVICLSDNAHVIKNKTGVVWRNKTYGLFEYLDKKDFKPNNYYLYFNNANKSLEIGMVKNKTHEVIANLWNILITF